MSSLLDITYNSYRHCLISGFILVFQWCPRWFVGVPDNCFIVGVRMRFSHTTVAIEPLPAAYYTTDAWTGTKPSVMVRLARLLVPRSLLHGSQLVDDPRAGQLLRHLEALGYRVQVERLTTSTAPQGMALTMSAENDWAHQHYAVSTALGHGDDEYACANALAEKVAADLEE
jgi:hypothetical protein